MKQTLLAVYAVLVTFLCLYLLSELKEKTEQLKEEIEIKYEYSVIIDSLMSEQEYFIEYLELKHDAE